MRFRMARPLRPSWYLFVIISFLLGTTVFLLVKLSESDVTVDGPAPFVNLTRVDRQKGASHSLSIIVMRDHKYFVQEIDGGVLSLYSECSYYQGVLPNDRFEALATALDSSEFQKISQPAHPLPRTRHMWLVFSLPRRQRKCLTVSDAEMQASPGLNSLLQWFRNTQQWSAGEPNRSESIKCKTSPPDVAAWCRDR